MKHDHEPKEIHQHELAYCPMCDVVYCKTCNKEWAEKAQTAVYTWVPGWSSKHWDTTTSPIST